MLFFFRSESTRDRILIYQNVFFLQTTAQELAEYFSNFSVVIEAKVIFDEHQIPKGYGFVTFQSEEDVQNVTEMGTLFLRNKKLNLGPAVKKQVPTPVVENSELVVVSDNMRGEFFYPCPVSTVPVNPYQACHPVPHVYYAPSGYVNMQTAWKQPDLQIAPPFSVNVSSGHTHTMRHPRRRAPRFRKMQRDTV